jgi:hypothetical protein
MSTIITRNSATSGSSPSSLVQGELAINVTDNRLFFGSGSGNVVKEFGVTSSYALSALSASYAVSASYEINYETSSSYADFAVSASYALTTPTPFRIATGSISASVDTGANVFRITSGSSTFFNIDNQGSTTISSSASNIFLIRNQNNTPVLTVSQSGVVIFATQSVDPAGTAIPGAFYFTSSSLFIGVE